VVPVWQPAAVVEPEPTTAARKAVLPVAAAGLKKQADLVVEVLSGRQAAAGGLVAAQQAWEAAPGF
jgi:ferritin-like metal-binding protein YciE